MAVDLGADMPQRAVSDHQVIIWLLGHPVLEKAACVERGAAAC